jgi:hypothetical protein
MGGEKKDKQFMLKASTPSPFFFFNSTDKTKGEELSA